ncbi:MAG: hypothetical protein A2233_00095 [Candidatus Kerfeldbacteria bacterium RIFOXYA2_FULL_38_24]|uniref:EamA domain-containing protein n=1 Tax=Candidatus Kerfeldbacteria bacterium RIFOXYB2_FULL_38_14 TaxID=1798547 RepID=A0A1G2BAF3_9BACT|nr:MAG: hypothetical protein A2233_00095 [Candidatus Kerfeldbacteria bacterium RIFOXYA2_FULL_38_24]OGY85995.1 MAG: hypothetical protein A2319_00300 [Candidatus Kerfeldbacteria bacterium RIFOXYB2_FULL_38_14]OGY90108.1 MAG: hypothetical protein A2458_03895 [Candidatus Kerfeldbacteria bacterium RIFOXYC2_FULL_38_9]
MYWITAVLIGHGLNALSYVLDKVLLTKSIKNPFAFTFYIGLLGLLIVVAAPWGLFLPSASLLIVDLLAGVFFSSALLFFFLALQTGETSRIVPFIGGAIPVFTYIFAFFFLQERLTSLQLWGFIVLVIGTILMALEDKKKISNLQSKKLSRQKWLFGILAALSFALSFGLSKIAFDYQPFLSAFIWTRFGGFFFPVLFLFSKNLRQEIFKAALVFKEKTGLMYLVAQTFGAGGYIFINYAISLASVSLVNAMQGVQYVFILVIALLGTIKYPNLLKENMSRKNLLIKILAVAVITAGLSLIAFS